MDSQTILTADRLRSRRDSFHAVVSHEHLRHIDGCGSHRSTQLDSWCHDLISIVCAASSLVVLDPIPTANLTYEDRERLTETVRDQIAAELAL